MLESIYHTVLVVDSFPYLFPFIGCIRLYIGFKIDKYSIMIFLFINAPLMQGIWTFLLTGEDVVKVDRLRERLLLFPELWNFFIATCTYGTFA